MTVTGPDPKGSQGTVYYDLEVCDPTQGDKYQIDGVFVSNFVNKSYFGLSGGSGRTNYLGLRLASFGVRPGGYLQYEKNGRAHQIYGSRVTAEQIAAKKKLGVIRRNQRRSERLTQGWKKSISR